MENKKRKISGLILAGTTIAGVASTAASAGLVDILRNVAKNNPVAAVAGTVVVGVVCLGVMVLYLMFLYRKYKNIKKKEIEEEIYKIFGGNTNNSEKMRKNRCNRNYEGPN